MIAQRFRSIMWASGAALAATGLYLVSVQVSAEHKRLAEINHQIDVTEHDIRMLDTELATRTNWRQLEKWNSDTLGLSTPSAAQFVGDTTALARFDPAKLKGAPEVPVAAMASVTEDAESLAAAKLQDKAQSLSVPETATVTAAAPDPVAAPVSEKLAQAQPPAHKGQAQRHFEGTSAVTHLVMLDDALREALHGKAQR